MGLHMDENLGNKRIAYTYLHILLEDTWNTLGFDPWKFLEFGTHCPCKDLPYESYGVGMG